MNVLHTEAQIGAAFDHVGGEPPSDLAPYQALWDTGATNSVITSRVVSERQLKPIGVAQVHTANGTHTAAVYLVCMRLPNGVGIPQLRVTEGTLQSADVLVGMDVIATGDFAVTNKNNQTVFSFRWPSQECLDFVAQTVQYKQVVAPYPRVGRNDPCPCGSGRKFKQCCGRGMG